MAKITGDIRIVADENPDHGYAARLYVPNEGEPRVLVPRLRNAFQTGLRISGELMAKPQHAAPFIVAQHPAGCMLYSFDQRDEPSVNYEYTVYTKLGRDSRPYWLLAVEARGRILQTKHALAAIPDSLVNANFNVTGERVLTVKVPVKSWTSDEVYEVTGYSDGTWECTCPGWRFRQNCKHIPQVRNMFSRV